VARCLPVAVQEYGLAAAKCPWFDWWLAQVVPPDCVEIVWEVAGYLAYSGNPLHTAIMLIGSGRNGKGTLLRVILAILGKQNTTSTSLADLVNTRFRTAELFGKIANIAGDIDATYLENTAILKAITGMDQIQAERTRSLAVAV
jgi:putative DNA primase/helicase